MGYFSIVFMKMMAKQDFMEKQEQELAVRLPVLRQDVERKVKVGRERELVTRLK